jgi:hypothetical protein
MPWLFTYHCLHFRRVARALPWIRSESGSITPTPPPPLIAMAGHALDPQSDTAALIRTVLDWAREIVCERGEQGSHCSTAMCSNHRWSRCQLVDEHNRQKNPVLPSAAFNGHFKSSPFIAFQRSTDEGIPTSLSSFIDDIADRVDV